MNESEERGAVGGKYGDKCNHCKLEYGREGHDACLGTLPCVMNACCGHGNETYAYVQIWSRYDEEDLIIRGKDAITIQEILKKYRIRI